MLTWWAPRQTTTLVAGRSPMAESRLRTAPVYGEEARKLAGINEVCGDKRHYADLQWQRPPEVLIVENDSICREITAKFLYSI